MYGIIVVKYALTPDLSTKFLVEYKHDMGYEKKGRFQR